MSYKPSSKEIDNVLSESEDVRYSYFIKKVADWGEAWTLGDDRGIVMMEADDGRRAAALWPARDFAERCATSEWAHLEPERVELDYLLDALLVDAGSDGYQVAVFPNERGRAKVVDPALIRSDLEAELDRF